MSIASGSSPSSPPQAAAAMGLNLDDLLSAQQTALKAVSELRRVIAEQDALRAEVARLQQENARLVATPSAAFAAPPPQPGEELPRKAPQAERGNSGGVGD